MLTVTVLLHESTRMRSQISGALTAELPGLPCCLQGARAVGAWTPDCTTNFLLFAVIGCIISMLTLFLFNLAFATAAACSRVMDFYLRASWFGGKDVAWLTCSGYESLF